MTNPTAAVNQAKGRNKTIRQFLAPYGFAAPLFVLSIFNFLLLIYDLIFCDGRETWSNFGKGIGMLFVGLVILGFTGSNVKKAS